MPKSYLRIAIVTGAAYGIGKVAARKSVSSGLFVPAMYHMVGQGIGQHMKYALAYRRVLFHKKPLEGIEGAIVGDATFT